jgi:hypothetical protein
MGLFFLIILIIQSLAKGHLLNVTNILKTTVIFNYQIQNPFVRSAARTQYLINTKKIFKNLKFYKIVKYTHILTLFQTNNLL